jgi:hypothetical protein
MNVTALPTITVAIQRGDACDPILGDTVGRFYRNRGHGGESLEITADGRFAYAYSLGCFSGKLVNFGFARLARGRLKLSPLKANDRYGLGTASEFHRIDWSGECFSSPTTRCSIFAMPSTKVSSRIAH